MKHRVLVSFDTETVWLEIDADSAETATLQAARSGGRVMRVESARAPAGTGRVRYSQGVFLQEALTLLKAGLNVVEVLEVLHRKEHDSGFQAVLARILVRVREGATFSSALSEHPMFSP